MWSTLRKYLNLQELLLFLLVLTIWYKSLHRNLNQNIKNILSMPRHLLLKETKLMIHGDIKWKSSIKSGGVSNSSMKINLKMDSKRNLISWPEPCAISKEFPILLSIFNWQTFKHILAQLLHMRLKKVKSNHSFNHKQLLNLVLFWSKIAFSELVNNSKARKSTWEQAQETLNFSIHLRFELISSFLVNFAQESIPSLENWFWC